MAIGINHEEMLEAGRLLREKERLQSVIEPLIKRYKEAADRWEDRSVMWIESEVLQFQCRAKSSVYRAVVRDLENIFDVW